MVQTLFTGTKENQVCNLHKAQTHVEETEEIKSEQVWTIAFDTAKNWAWSQTLEKRESKVKIRLK